MTAPDQRRIPDLLVERVFLGEATEEERARVMADPDAADRLRAMPMENARFFMAHPPEEVVPRIEGRVRIDEARRRLAQRNGLLGGLVMVPLAAAALSLFVVTQGPSTGTGTGGGPGVEHTTAKGLSSRLRVYHQTSKGVRRIAPAQVMRKGDRLQLGIIAGDATNGAVFSIDGRGQVTQHFPVDGGGTTLTNGELRIPEAYELDDAPDYERFLLVTGAGPVDVAAVRAAVETLAGSADAREGELALPEGLDQGSFLVRKEER
ncbi:MAG: hypothetical protein H6735_01260 [Alphaproteobacteria bacterium]|nr:hypothetical protein [Alphaproteobacteria bacterium]